MIVRWGLRQLPAVLAELRVKRPYLLATDRWDSPFELLNIEHFWWSELPTAEIDRVVERAADFDVLVGLGGGSTIDTAKAVSAETGLPLVSIPTTYAGAEWTPYFGIRDPDRKMKGGGSGAHLRGVVYEPELTLSLPRDVTVGTAMNALAHCAEAMYAEGHNEVADEHALTGARLIGEWLPRVVAAPKDLEGRTKLLEGAMHAGEALGASMLALGHAMAQALGGRYGLPHGAMNALTLPQALSFNEEVAPEAVLRFRGAVGTDVEELARLGGFERLRDFGVPEEDLSEIAAATIERAGAKANPRQASAAEVEQLLHNIY
jgi:maleylacetate reductase